MRYELALRHTSSVRYLETFRSIFDVPLPLVHSNPWVAQLAVLNDPRYAQLETNLWGSGRPGKVQFPRALHHSKRRHRLVAVKGSARNGRRHPKCLSARCLRMVKEDTEDPSEGASYVWMAADEAVFCTRAFLMMWRSS
ncbi:uncharacterized protein TNCV_2307141 [Trichonephila clavipes]|nr:uncharacterized protein TNCV_2307141 [Trichonephila clavipes]